MAKQNVTYIERHLEKIVIGVAGAVLLFVLVSNVALSPHAVEVDGDSVGPADFYAKMGEQIDTARDRMVRATPPDRSDNGQGTPVIPPVTTRVADDDSLLFPIVPPNVPLPQLKGYEQVVGPRGKIELAGVLPPTTPLLSSGKAVARLPQQATRQMGVLSEPVGQNVLGVTRDYHWVTGAAAISRRAQRDEYAKANYLADRAELVVAEVRVQRRAQLPNGEWSDPLVIQPFMRERIVGKPEVRLAKNEDSFGVSPEDQVFIQEYRTVLATKETQALLLRPPFQEYLVGSKPEEDYREEWKIPKTLIAPDKSEIDMTAMDWAIIFEEEEKGRPGVAGGTALGAGARPGRGPAGEAGWIGAGGAAGGPAAGEPVGTWAKKRMEEAEALLKKGRFLDARDIWLAVAANTEPAVKRYRTQAEDLLRRHQADFDRAEAVQMGISSGGTALSDTQLGPDVEPLWFTDLSVQPGETYQYRVSIVALNRYAGVASPLKNIQDAEKVLTQGEWSGWSEAVTVQPSKYLIFTEITREGRALLELFVWSNGVWEKVAGSLGTGDAVTFSRANKPPLEYDAVIVSMDPSRPFVRRIAGTGKDESFKYESQATTGSLLLVSSSGRTEERFIAEDAQVRAEANRLWAEERKRRAAAANKELVAPVQPAVRPTAPRGEREREGGRRAAERGEREGGGRR